MVGKHWEGNPVKFKFKAGEIGTGEGDSVLSSTVDRVPMYSKGLEPEDLDLELLDKGLGSMRR